MKIKVFLFIILLSFGCKESIKDKKNNEITSLSSLVDLDNRHFDITNLKGKKVLLNYWATWCKPCKDEMPSLLLAQKILIKENYVFVLVSDESIEEITNFKNRYQYNFLFLKSKKALLSQGISILPTTYVYNSKGKKIEEILGVKKWNSQEVLNRLKRVK